MVDCGIIETKKITTDKVAIILLNWNSYSDTYECLKALEENNYKDFDVYVVDNDSKDNSFNLLQEDYNNKKIKLNIIFLQSGGNLGFAGGNNVGVRAAYEQNYEYIWLLNNDTIPEPDSLQYLVDAMCRDKSIGIVGSKIYFYNTDIIWFAGGKYNKWLGRAGHIGEGEKDTGQYDEKKEVDYITGCSLLFRRELLDSIGCMKEDYFLYYEETDWNIRSAKKGWKQLFVPESIVHHKVAVSSGGLQNLAPYVDYYGLRNAFVLVKRTQPFLCCITAFLNMIGRLGKKILNIFIRNQDRKLERFFYITLGVLHAITTRMGKHPDYKK